MVFAPLVLDPHLAGIHLTQHQSVPGELQPSTASKTSPGTDTVIKYFCYKKTVFIMFLYFFNIFGR